MSNIFLYSESAQCRLPGKLDQVAPALARLEAYVTVRGVTAKVWNGIELAVAEALNNAVIHGCKDMADSAVTLRWTWVDDMLIVRVHDPSQFMPATGSADLPEDPLAESGRGQYLMVTLMDEVSHILIDGHHAIELKKQVGPMSWSPHLLAENEATMNSLTTELSSCYENLSAIFQFSEILATARDFTGFSETVLGRLNTLVKAQHSYIRLETEDKDGLRQIVSVGNEFIGLPPEIDLKQECLETEVFKTKIGKVNIVGSKMLAGDPLLSVQGNFSVCPISFRMHVLGCLVVIRPPHADSFLGAESALIRVVADFLGIAYIAGRSHERHKVEEMARRELEIASSIQQSLMPHSFPEHAPYRTFGLCRSAREVGGDYFDIIPIKTHGLLLVIADVMGKGMPAALLATIFRTAVRARQEWATTPGKLLTEINRQLSADLDKLDMFITAKLAFLSYKDHTLHYADAGHCPILIRRKGESALREIQADGFPLGVSDRFDYPAEVFHIEPEDLLVFITDGIYENLGENGTGSSLDYLKKKILALQYRNLSDFCHQVLELSTGLGGNQPFLDDRTMLVLERGK